MNKYPMLIKVEKSNGKLVAFDSQGNDVTDLVSYSTRGKAVKFGTALYKESEDSKFKQVALEQFDRASNVPVANEPVDVPDEQAEVMNFISNSYSLKPESLVMKELKWKYLVRSAVRGRNIMMTGPAGCGKTMAAKSLVNSLDRPDFYFNLGATQDPRATLIGNTHFDKEKGTYFSEALFVKAIQTENAVILLDELTRAHPDAWNILMTPLDPLQRYVRLDESEDSEVVPVADGVTFVATANVGNEYTSTRVMDRALLDRFVTVEMDELDYEEEVSLLKLLYPDADVNMLGVIGEITTHTRKVVKSAEAKITDALSTRSAVEMAGLAYDGFNLIEIAEASIYPHFSDDGGADSERTYMKQFVQKYVQNEDTPEELFSLNPDENQDDAVVRTPY